MSGLLSPAARGLFSCGGGRKLRPRCQFAPRWQKPERSSVIGALVSCPLLRVPSPVPSRLFGVMEDEDGYMVLDKRGAVGSPRPLRDAGIGGRVCWSPPKFGGGERKYGVVMTGAT